MIRLIAADIDGTLLNSNHEMSERTVQAIKYAQSKGAVFLISTGRMYPSAKAQIESYGIKCSYLCNSGAQIYDEEGNLVRDLPMRPKIAHFIVEKFEQWKVPADIQGSEVFYMYWTPWQMFVKVWFFAKRGSLLRFLKRNLSYNKTDGTVKHLGKPSEVFNYTETIYKISASGIDPDKVVRMKEYFRKTGKVNAVSSFCDNVEITDVNAEKGSSVAWYADKLGIAPEEVMTIGDSDNDLSMIAWDFGYTVAMENGMQTVKDAAKYVTRSNDEDGVAVFIEENL